MRFGITEQGCCEQKALTEHGCCEQKAQQENSISSRTTFRRLAVSNGVAAVAVVGTAAAVGTNGAGAIWHGLTDRST